jgi:hypothetical protein
VTTGTEDGASVAGTKPTLRAAGPSSSGGAPSYSTISLGFPAVLSASRILSTSLTEMPVSAPL